MFLYKDNKQADKSLERKNTPNMFTARWHLCDGDVTRKRLSGISFNKYTEHDSDNYLRYTRLS